MKKLLKTTMFQIANFLELVISVIVAIAIAILACKLFLDALNLSSVTQEGDALMVFLGKAMTLAVGVEFIKMLCKHTPGTIIEVLLFAIARQMVVQHMTAFDTLIGVVSIGVLFATRKYLFCNFDETDKMVLRASQKVKLVNMLFKIEIPPEDGETLREVVIKHLTEEHHSISVGACVYIRDFALRIDGMRGELITSIEIIKII